MHSLKKGHLPRLQIEWYRGDACIFWTHTMNNRARGWLDSAFHSVFREVLIHTLARHRLICPAYCLMPDHFHLVLLGLSSESDQKAATAFLRMHIQPALGNVRLQRQPHDHVFREAERERDALAATCRYVLDNPVRAGLVASREEYRFIGAAAVGYPQFDPRQECYWEKLWPIYYKLRAQNMR